MRRRGLAVWLLLALLAPATPVAAGGPVGLAVSGRFSGGAAGVAAGVFGVTALGLAAEGAAERGRWRDDPALLIVDATPPDAQVYLDGRPLGPAGALVALALPVALGPHTLHVLAPGHRPWVRRFVADGSFPVRLRATLSPE